MTQTQARAILPYAQSDFQDSVTVRLEGLRACFAGRLLTEPADIAAFETDWRKRWHGRALAVAQPDTARDAAAIVAWCSRHGVPVVPQGGNTGLSGGAAPGPAGDELVLSLVRLNRLRALDSAGRTLTAEAGCIVQTVQHAAEQAGLLFPLSLASEGSCTVGGILSTNAGGVHVLRYGNARALCLGVEVVTPAGEIWDGLRRLRKDNAGLDLRDLFIGAEGTLGIITAAVLRLFPRPAERCVGFAAVRSPAAAARLLALAEMQAGEGLTGFELMDDLSLAMVRRHRPALRLPVAAHAPWHALIEISVARADGRASEAMTALLAAGLHEGWVIDGTIAASAAQCAGLWAVREAISEAQTAEGGTIRHDIALPIPEIADFLDDAAEAMRRHFPTLRPVVFGHLGDGNLHYNVLPPAGRGGAAHAAWFLAHEQAVNRLIHDLVAERSGSVSAEHGLGVLRRAEAARYKSAVELNLMAAIKAAIDPQGLMNPGKGLGMRA